MNARQHTRFQRSLRAIVALALFATSGVVVRADDGNAPVMPAGTHVNFHINAPISSNGSKTGDAFAFELLAPIVLVDRTIPVLGTTGSGTIFLAGHAGSQGHEGDLTLRLDSLHTPDGRTFTFDDQRFQIDGRNRKIASGVLGLIPYAGIGARFIRGSDVRVDPTTPIETVLLRSATSAAITLDTLSTPQTSPASNR